MWVADITYIATNKGWLYLAVVLDLYSRRVVGWATSDSLAAELSCQALRMAVRERSPVGGVLHHSDRGVQYACEEYPGDAWQARDYAEHEPQGQLLRQRGDGELLQRVAAGMDVSSTLCDAGGRPGSRCSSTLRCFTIVGVCIRRLAT